ncbi:Acyl-CoA carboxylase epsilon subunit [Cellulosimicrobium aquatile]|uniref:Acyl-CoA carboxylase epsilon subunit n=1 Tax=Cellulosimicrobium aquatile TaxID=1612203 RepID=A0A1N6T6F5_9MICO|nr:MULTISPECIES: acyl-CoA carboxylase epsilon subunit [Cellulosimicrobium]MDQ8040709.1 acyl-CoA carboxylase epsilon subunit [Cellulosimicrobium sp. XJ-DQ-B-000]SIQ48696.1 Acyl-CoA carboxylase epsilon subunit [Cellulosimicrobium aquatile]
MSEQQPVGATPSVRVVRGAPDELEVAALVAGLAAAAAAGDEPDDVAPVDEWTNRARVLRGTGDGATAKSFGGRSGRHNADSWRWSLRS